METLGEDIPAPSEPTAEARENQALATESGSFKFLGASYFYRLLCYHALLSVPNPNHPLCP